MPANIDPNQVIWDTPSPAPAINPDEVVWDQPETDEEKFKKLNKDLEDRALVGQRAFEGITNLGEQSRAYDEKINKDLEDQALFGQRALDESLALGESSRRYDQEHPTLLRDVVQRLKSKGQVAANLLTGAVSFPIGLAAGAGALVAGEGMKGFQERQRKVGEFFTPDVGELTPEAQGTLEAVGKVTGAPAKVMGAGAAAIGGEGWRPVGEILGDLALIGLPIAAKTAATRYVGRGLKKNLSDLIQNNNKIGLTPEESGAMAESLINQAQGMKIEATGKPLNLWEKWKAKQGFARMGEELKAVREGGPAEPYSPEFAAEVRGPKRIQPPPGYTAGENIGFMPENAPYETFSPELAQDLAGQPKALPEPIEPTLTRGEYSGRITGPTDRFSPEFARGIRQVRQPALPNAQGFELVGPPYDPSKAVQFVQNLRSGAPIAMGNPTGSAHFDFQGQTFEAPLPTGNSPIGSKYGAQWALDQIRTGKARPIGGNAPGAPRTNDLPPEATTTPVLPPAPGQPQVAGSGLPPEREANLGKTSQGIDIGSMTPAYRDSKTGKVFESNGVGEGHMAFAERIGLTDLSRNRQIDKPFGGPWNIPGYDYGLVDTEGKFRSMVELDSLLRGAKPVIQPRQKKETASLTQWVKSKGGIWDKSLPGEVRQLGQKEGRTVALVRKATGRPLDELAALAIEDGWLPPGSGSREFLNLVTKEIQGQKATRTGAVVPDDQAALNAYYGQINPNEVTWDQSAPSMTPPPASGAPGVALPAQGMAPMAGTGPPPPAPGQPLTGERRQGNRLSQADWNKAVAKFGIDQARNRAIAANERELELRRENPPAPSQPFTLFEGQKAFTSPEALKREAEKYGVTYKGEYAFGGKKFADTFTDRLTNGDFSLMPGDDLKAAVLKHRKAFVDAGKLDRGALNLAAVEKKYGTSEIGKALLKQRGHQYDFTYPIDLEIATKALTDLKKVEALPVKGSGIKTLGKGISTELIQKGYVNLTGRKFKDISEAAAMFAVFRNPSFETHRFIFVKTLPEGGYEILGHEGRTSRLPGVVRLFKTDPRNPLGSDPKEWHELKARIKRIGADGVFSLHNHPSGKVKASEEDKLVAAHLRDNIPEYLGSLIINHEKYSLIRKDSLGMLTFPQELHLDPKGRDKFITPSKEHNLLGARIQNPSELAALGQHIELEDKHSVIFFMDSEMKVRGAQDVHNGVIQRQDFPGYLRNRAVDFGTQVALVMTKDVNLAPRLAELFKKNIIAEGGVVRDGDILSMANTYVNNRAQPNLWMGKKIGSFKVAEPVTSYEAADPQRLEKLKKELSFVQKERDTAETKVRRLDRRLGTIKSEAGKKVNAELSRRAKTQLTDLDNKVKGLIGQIVDTERDISRLGIGTKPSDISQLTDSLDQVSSPKDSLRSKVKKAVDISEKAGKVKDKTSSALDGMKSVTAGLWSKWRRPPGHNEYKGVLGDYLYSRQSSSLEGQRFSHKMMQKVPSRLRREALVNWIQAGGDDAVLLQRAKDSQPGFKSGYEAARALNPSERTLAQNISNYFDSKLEEAKKWGMLKQGVTDYVSQLFKKDDPHAKAIIAEIDAGILKEDPFFIKKRIFHDYFEAEQAGMVPKNKDIGFLLGTYDQAFNEAIASRTFVKSLLDAKSSAGKPLAIVSGAGKVIPVEGTTDTAGLVIRPKSLPKDVQEIGYRNIDHPALKGWKWITEDPLGDPVLMEGELVIHPEIYPHLKNVLSKSAIQQNPVGKVALRTIQEFKATLLSGIPIAPFHQMNVGQHAIFHKVNPFNTKSIDLKDPIQKELVRHGLMISDRGGMEIFSEGVYASGLFGKLPGIGQISRLYGEYLFGDLIPRLKMAMAVSAVKHNQKWYSKKLSEDQIYEKTASESNAAFGEQNYKWMGRSKTFQDILRLILLAPDFLEARARFVGQALKPYGREQSYALIRGALGMALVAGIVNALLNNGDPRLDKPFTIVAGGREYGLRSVQGDIWHLLSSPRTFVYFRMNPTTSRTIVEYLTGRNAWGAKRDAIQQIQDFFTTHIPIPLQGLIKDQDRKIWESALQSLGVNVWKEKKADMGLPRGLKRGGSSRPSPEPSLTDKLLGIRGPRQRIKRGG